MISVRICTRILGSRLERFVKEKNLRLTHDRPADRDPLLLGAGERFRFSIEQRFDAEDACGVDHPLLDFRFGKFPQLEPKSEIVVDAHVRVERVILKNHRDVAVFRRDSVDALFADVNVAFRNLLQSRDHSECRRLPAA